MALELNVWSGAYRVVEDERCQEVPADIVSAAVTSMTELALDAVVADLGLPERPTIKWFASESQHSKRLRTRYGSVPWVTFEAGDDTKGIVLGSSPSTIWIRYDVDDLAVPEIVAHEGKHVAQYRQYLDGSAALPDDAAAERDASQYAADLLARCEAEGDAARAASLAAKTAPRPAVFAPVMTVRKSRGTAGQQEFHCEYCCSWVAVNTRHACPAAATWRTP